MFDDWQIAVVAPTHGDVRRISFEGWTGLLNIIPEEIMWKGKREKAYNRSLAELRLANGALFRGFSAEEPDRLRGPQHHLALGEELASWRYRETYDQLLFTLRLGTSPRFMAATTPRAVPLIVELVEESKKEGSGVLVTSGNTFENTSLPPKALARLRARYEGTRLGRQELHAELLGDTPGALWTREIIERSRVRLDTTTLRPSVALPEAVRMVIGVDPMVGKPDPDALPGSGPETGILVAFRGGDGHAYVIEDGSLSGVPAEWATRVIDLYRKHRGDVVIAEVNNGGEMVEDVIATRDRTVNVEQVTASRGKITRAEPISSLYERNLVHHVGYFAELESQMTTYVPGEKSPDRMDALVWALTELMVDAIEVPLVLPHSEQQENPWIIE